MAKPRIALNCAVNGVAPSEEDEALLELYGSREDDAPEIPVGWTRITLEYRRINPQFVELQQVKAATVQQYFDALAKVDQTQASLRALTLQVDASFAALSAMPEYTPSILDQETVYLSPVERDPQVARRAEKVCKLLGVVPFVSAEELASMASQLQAEAAGNMAEAVTTTSLGENDQQEVVGTPSGITVRRRRSRPK